MVIYVDNVPTYGESLKYTNGGPAVSAGDERQIELDYTNLEALGVKLSAYTVAGAPSAATRGAGSVIYTSNGNTGSPCLAVSNGTNWLRVALGAAIASS